MDVDSIGASDEKEANSQQAAFQSELPAAAEINLNSMGASDEKNAPSQQTISTPVASLGEQNNNSPDAGQHLEIAKEMIAAAARMEMEEQNNRGDQSQDEDTPSEEKETEERGSRMNMDLVMSAIENAEDPDSHLDSDLVAEANAIQELKSILAATRMTA